MRNALFCVVIVSVCLFSCTGSDDGGLPDGGWPYGDMRLTSVSVDTFGVKYDCSMAYDAFGRVTGSRVHFSGGAFNSFSMEYEYAADGSFIRAVSVWTSDDGLREDVVDTMFVSDGRVDSIRRHLEPGRDWKFTFNYAHGRLASVEYNFLENHGLPAWRTDSVWWVGGNISKVLCDDNLPWTYEYEYSDMSCMLPYCSALAEVLDYPWRPFIGYGLFGDLPENLISSCKVDGVRRWLYDYDMVDGLLVGYDTYDVVEKKTFRYRIGWEQPTGNLY